MTFLDDIYDSFINKDKDIILLDKGTYGCVVNPPLYNNKYVLKKIIPYNNVENKDIGKIYIHGSREFKKELKILKMIKDIDPKSKFTVKLKGALIIKANNIAKNKELIQCLKIKNLTDKNMLYVIIQENGGKKINSNYKISFKTFLKLFRTFLEGMKLLQKHKMIHRDIKPANVLINDKKINLIDFGLLTKSTRVYNSSNKYILAYKYPFYPPEFYIASILLSSKNNIKSELDNIIDIMNKNNYFDQTFLTSELKAIYINGVKNFIQTIKDKKFTKYNQIFNGNLALKTDIFSLAYIIKALNDRIVFSNNKEKEFLNDIYMLCIDCNPYTRTNVKNLYKIINKTYISNKNNLIGGNVNINTLYNTLYNTFVDNVPTIKDNYIAPKYLNK